MNITIGSDHGAVDLKEEVKMVLHEFGDIRVKDIGTFGEGLRRCCLRKGRPRHRALRDGHRHRHRGE